MFKITKSLNNNYVLSLREITIINAENNWVADWNDEKQRNHWNVTYSLPGYYMCIQALEFLLSDKVTDEQRKIWVEGV